MKSVGVLAFHPAFTPPRSGGELRLYNLYRRVADRGFRVELLTPTYSHHEQELVAHTPNFQETRFPKTSLYNKLHHLNDRMIGFAECSGLVSSIACIRHEAFRREAQRLAETADVLTQAYAFLTPLIPHRRRARQLLVYDAHNVETELARTMFGSGLKGRAATARIAALERRMLREADVVMACSDDDAEQFITQMGVDRSKIVVIPNGVDVDEIRPASSPEERAAARALLELSDRPACFFIGSFHPPNIEAVNLIISELAKPYPEVDFLIAGKVCQAFEGQPIPANLRLLGLVSEEQKHALLHGCDIALNTMTSGSGTNLKMLDYLAAGLPILSTPTGARGLSIEHCVQANVQEPGGLRTGLKDMLEDRAFARTLAENARRHAVERFSWKSIGDDVANVFEVRTGRRVLVLNDYPVLPAEAGGQVRVGAVLDKLADSGASVTLLTLSANGPRRFQPRANLEEINIPRSFWHRRLDMRLNRWMGCGCDDASAALVTGWLSREYRRALRREVARADAVVLSHPYMEPVSRIIPKSARLYYDSHNTEFALKQKLYKPTLLGRFLTSVVKRAELSAARRAEGVFCVSQQNLDDLSGVVADISAKGSVAPNGVDCRKCVVRSPQEKREMKRLAGLPDAPLAVFLGSGHPPNRDAVCVIRDRVAPMLPGVTFVIIGSVCGWFHGQGLGENVIAMGPVDGMVKDYLLQGADVALNPMLEGSGTSLKLFDYLAHGLPVLTTRIGARGLSDDELRCLVVAEAEQFADQLRALLADRDRVAELAARGRELAASRYDWSVALKPFERITAF